MSRGEDALRTERGPVRAGGEEALWREVVRAIEKRGGGSLDMWFRSILKVSVGDGRVVVEVPNDFSKQWIRDKYEPQICREMKRLTGKTFALDVVALKGEDGRADRAPRANRANRTNREERHAGGEPAPCPGGVVSEKFTFENFVEGPSNELALSAARMVAQGGEGVPSPLYIHGPTGTGKTHLLSAIYHARRGRDRSGGVIYVSAEAFVNQFIENLGTHSMKEFRGLYRRECRTLLIDDIQFLASKQRTQEEFFHCFNELHHGGRTIVIAADRPPAQLERMEEGLRSRFGGGLVVDVKPPGIETRLAIIGRKAEALGMAVPPGLDRTIAEHACGSVREIEGMLIRLQVQSRIRKTPLNEEIVKEMIAHYSGRTTGRVAVDEVIRQVAAAYGLKISDIRGERRHRTVSLPRQVAMYICRESLSMSYPEIAERFGGKNHTTVLSACRKIKGLIASDLSVFSTIERLTGQLGLAAGAR